MTDQTKALLISLSATTAVSTLCGLCFWSFDSSFFGGFLLAFIIQFIFGYFYNTYLAWKDRKFAEILENENNKVFTSTLLSCAYCNVQNKVPISLLTSNVFKCKSCNQANRVYVQFTTVRLTNPLISKDGAIVDEDAGLEDGITQSTINEGIKIS